jgi:hypothetical protein
MRDFESIHKRKIDIAKRPILRQRIPGLRGDKKRGPGVEQKGFNDNYLLMDTYFTLPQYFYERAQA